ncbi:MAG: ATP-binding protein [Burkholderiaceae bacterium]
MKLRSPSLFWRTFGLVLLLIVASMAAWLQSLRVLERAPRAAQVAQHVISAANLTRYALIYADPVYRRELLGALAANEGLRIFPFETTDSIQSLPNDEFTALIEAQVRAKLGPKTRLADAVNGERGLWVSLLIDGDDYWLMLERDPLERRLGTRWIGWAIAALLLSILGALLITRLLNQPLARLTLAVRALGAGQRPAPLPERGPAEIETVNRSFNRMVADLEKLAADREVLLAGISHDLRTPLTRLRLEVEMAAVCDETRAAMTDDIEQMDAIVRQFLDYARQRPGTSTEIELGPLLADTLARSRIDTAAHTSVQLSLTAGIKIQGNPTDLARAIENLIVNADRYGRGADTRLELSVALRRESGHAVISVADHGAGIAAAERERVLRPFERGEASRGGPSGAGLGLPIVDRIARRAGGTLSLKANPPHGLLAELRFPLVP